MMFLLDLLLELFQQALDEHVKEKLSRFCHIPVTK